jgi:hypothetical protein
VVDDAINHNADQDLEGAEVENFFGQLWETPCSCLHRSSHIPSNLFWIHHDQWESKQFEAHDFFPAKSSDVWCSAPKKLTSVELAWKLGVCRSFRQVLIEGTDGRGGRGCGRGKG